MKLNKLFTLKASAVAVAAVVAGSAFAAPVDMDSATPVPFKYASEKTISAATTLTAGALATQDASALLGATFAADAVAYVRFDLSSGTFTANPTIAVTVAPAGGVTASVAQGGIGQSFVIFALAPTVGGQALAATGLVTMTGTNLTVTSATNITLTYRLFETLTNAANATLPLKTVSNVSFVTFSPALTFTGTAYDAVATSAIADVAAVPAYTTFTAGATVKALATMDLDLNTVAVPATGAAAVVGDIIANTNTLSVTGDFSLAKNDDGTYTGAALARVFIASDAACTTSIESAATLSATTATFAALTAAELIADAYLCVTAEGTPPIIASAYTGTLDMVPQTGFTVADPALVAGSITRNGGQIDIRSYIPAGTVGYTSFVRVINGGSTSAQVSGQWLYEDGTQGATVSLGDAIPAGGSITWPSSTIEAALGAPTVIGNNRPRLRLTAPSTSLQAQSFFLNPDNSFATMHGND